MRSRRKVQEQSAIPPTRTRQTERPGPGILARFTSAARHLGNKAIAKLLRREPSSLDVNSRLTKRLGASFATDLSGVRLSNDADSHAAAAALGVRAFVLRDVVFLGADAPPPTSAEGERLLAHELAHVAQQRSATAVREDDASAPGDPHERQATAMAAAAVRGEAPAMTNVGAPAAMQAEGGVPALSITKRFGRSRTEARQLLEAYFDRVCAAQGGQTLAVTADVKDAIRRIGWGQDLDTQLKLESWALRTIYPGNAAELADQVASLLPDPIDEASLAHLAALPAQARKPGLLAGATDVVKKTAPSLSPEQQKQQWEFDNMVSESRRGDPTLIGPLKSVGISVDLERIRNVAKQIPRTFADPSDTIEGRSYPEVEAAIASVSDSSLLPDGVKGTADASEYITNAQDMARLVARDLDVAQQKKSTTVDIRLPDAYGNVKDKSEIVARVAAIIRLVRNALPHHASQVMYIDIYVGKHLAQRVVRTGGE